MEKTNKGNQKKMIAAVIIAVVVLLLSAVLIYRYTHRTAFHRQVAALTEAGFAVSLADLEKRYTLPDGADNAADVYIEAFDSYVEPTEDELEWLPTRGQFITTDEMPPYPPEVIATIKATLEKNRRCLELFDKAAQMEHCLLPRTNQNYYFFTDHLSELRRAALLLTERNLYLAQTRQADALFESLATTEAITRCLSAQPNLIDYLVTMAIQGMFVADIETSLNLTTFTVSQLATLQQQLRRMLDTNSLADALISERVRILEFMRFSSLAEFEEVGYWMFGNFWDQPLFMLYSLSGLKYKDAVLLLDYADQAIKATDLPLHEQLAVLDGIGDEISGYSRIHWLFHMIVLDYGRIFPISLRVRGSLMCGETALAIERYRLEHQALPDSLEALVPEYLAEVPRDPFDGAPLRYVLRETGGYTVYTIGEDGIDHGGLTGRQLAEQTGEHRSMQGDWPFTVRH